MYENVSFVQLKDILRQWPKLEKYDASVPLTLMKQKTITYVFHK